MKKIVLFALLFLLSPLASTAQQLFAVKNTTPNGYNFWLYVPGGYKDHRDERQKNGDKKTPEALPIVIFLHGRSLSGTDLNKVRKYGTLDALAAGRKINAIVIAPQVKMNDWWRPNRVMSLVNWVADNYDVDTSRIYVLGMSLGGYGALDFAAAYPKETAAAMAFCGGSTRKPAELANLNEVPLWIMHGTADNLVPISESRRVYNAMKSANANTPRLRYDEFAGANHSIYARVFYTSEAYEWLFKHSTTDASRKVDKTVQIPHSRISSQPYRGLNMGGRSTAFAVKHKTVTVPETSTLKQTPKASSKSSKSSEESTSTESTATESKTTEKAAETKATSKSTHKATEKSTDKSSKSTTKSTTKSSKTTEKYHTITSGDTLSGLAVKYNTTVKQLCEWNNITETTLLQLNQKLRVKGEVSKHKYHTITSGDTLSGLAVKYDTTVKKICELNNITETTLLQLNKKLRVK